MKVVVPIKITPANYTKEPPAGGYTNNGDSPAWSVATAYTVGQQVIVDSLQSQFQCVANNTGTAPTLTMTTPWIRIGASNAWKPFDGSVNSQMISLADSDYYTPFFNGQKTWFSNIVLKDMGAFDTVCILNSDVTAVFLTYVDGFGTTTYNVNLYAVDTTPIIDAWTYCFAECLVQRDFVIEGIDGWGTTSSPAGGTPTLYIALFGEGHAVTSGQSGITVPAKTGEVVVGVSYELGDCKADAKRRLVDYSRKDKDQFGNVVLVPRAYSYQASFDLEIAAKRKNFVTGMLEKLRATACVYYPSAAEGNKGVIIYGYPSDFEITYSTPDVVSASLQIEGLT